MRPGWYWVLYRTSDELELAELVEVPTARGLGWQFAGVDEVFEFDAATPLDVHADPIMPPEARMCAHPDAFRRQRRCVACGTFNLPESPQEVKP